MARYLSSIENLGENKLLSHVLQNFQRTIQIRSVRSFDQSSSESLQFCVAPKVPASSSGRHSGRQVVTVACCLHYRVGRRRGKSMRTCIVFWRDWPHGHRLFEDRPYLFFVWLNMPNPVLNQLSITILVRVSLELGGRGFRGLGM